MIQIFPHFKLPTLSRWTRFRLWFKRMNYSYDWSYAEDRITGIGFKVLGGKIYVISHFTYEEKRKI